MEKEDGEEGRIEEKGEGGIRERGRKGSDGEEKEEEGGERKERRDCVSAINLDRDNKSEFREGTLKASGRSTALTRVNRM